MTLAGDISRLGVMAIRQSWPALLICFGLAGVGLGFAETAETTMVAQFASRELRGSAFGLLGLTQAAGDLGSTAVVGSLWATLGPTLGFSYWMLMAAVVTGAVARRASPVR